MPTIAHRDEHPAPAERDHQAGEDRRGDGRAERRSTVPDAGGQSAIAHVVPVAHHAHGRREHRRLAQAEEHARDGELPEAGHEARDRLRDRPQGKPRAEQPMRPHPVDQRAARQLREGVGPQEGRQQQPHIRDGQAEFLADQRVGDGEGGAVEIVQRPGDHQHGQRRALRAPDTGWRVGSIHPISSRPSSTRICRIGQDRGRGNRRGRGRVSFTAHPRPVFVIARSPCDEAIHAARTMDCRAALAMTATPQERLAMTG